MRGVRISSGSLSVLLLLIIGCLYLTLAPAGAKQRGNSAAAKACQKGGYKSLFREDGTGFANTGECVSYAARGGAFKAPVEPVTPMLEWSSSPDGDGFTVTLHGEGLLFPSNIAVMTTIDDGPTMVTVPVLADGTAGPFSGSIPCEVFLPLFRSFKAEATTASGDFISAQINDTEVCPPPGI